MSFKTIILLQRVSRFAAQFYGLILNCFIKVATELGFIGLLLWIGYLLTFIKNPGNTVIDNKYPVLACSMICQLTCIKHMAHTTMESMSHQPRPRKEQKYFL